MAPTSKKLLKKQAREGKKSLKRAAESDEELEISDEEDFDFDGYDPQADEDKSKLDVEESSDDEGHDSDRELQIALRDGLLKNDKLNYIVQKKRPIINKTTEISEKIAEFSKKLPWIETLDVVTQCSLTKEMINNDFEREMQFYKQAEKAVQIAVPKLLAMGVKILRPSDYYAEMSKTDGHMQKVRKRLLAVQAGKERQEAIRRMREEKKYATKVQRQVLDNKLSEKKKLMEAVKKHKKGMKGQLEDMLNNVKQMDIDMDGDGPSSSRGQDRNPGGSRMSRGRGGINNRNRNFKREYKDEKFGAGGKKKGTKRNDKESFEDVFNTGKGRGGKGSFGRGGRGGGGGRGRGRR